MSACDGCVIDVDAEGKEDLLAKVVDKLIASCALKASAGRIPTHTIHRQTAIRHQASWRKVDQTVIGAIQDILDLAIVGIA